MKISSKDISVIVQGHIKGKSNDKIADRWTYLALESIRKHLPEAEIILATFTECDVKNLPYDTLVLCEDPGYLDLGNVNKLVGNTNRQIISSKSGLAKAGRKYSLKMRYDLILEGTDFLNNFDQFNEYSDEYRIFKKRILSCTSISIHPKKFSNVPFAPSDWFHFGLCEDVHNLWDIDLIKQPDKKNPGPLTDSDIKDFPDICRYSAEQYIWVTFLRKYGSVQIKHIRDIGKDTVYLSELSVVNNFVLLEPEQLPVTCCKYKDKSLLTYSKKLNYSHSDWLALYEKYCLKGYFKTDEPADISFSYVQQRGRDYYSKYQNNPLLSLGLDIINQAATIRFDFPAEKLDPLDTDKLNCFPGQNYHLMAATIQCLQSKFVFEFSTGDDLSTLSIDHFLEKPSFLARVLHKEYPSSNNDHSVLDADFFSRDDVVELNMDLSLEDQFNKVIIRIKDADLIVFDLKDGILLGKILRHLKAEKTSRKMYLFIKNTRVWSVAPVWYGIEDPKFDLTSFGSEMGVGLVELFNE